MKKEDLIGSRRVINLKYGTEELILMPGLIMKDSAKGWIPAVIYIGPDRLSPDHELKIFCKAEEDFLNEFELA